MTEQRANNLKELQRLDSRIAEARQRIAEFDPRLAEVEQPALVLEGELGTARTRLQELKLEERRIELSSEEKRTRRKRLDERLSTVKNLREEAAVSAELEMVKRSLQNDEQEMLTLVDQLRKMEDRASELETNYKAASERVGPERDALLAERTEVEKSLESLRAERSAFAKSVNSSELKVYDAIRAGGRQVAVSDLTEDGACGHCYGMVPLQLRNEIRHNRGLNRCEACGVILTAPSSVAAAPSPTGGEGA